LAHVNKMHCRLTVFQCYRQQRIYKCVAKVPCDCDDD